MLFAARIKGLQLIYKAENPFVKCLFVVIAIVVVVVVIVCFIAVLFLSLFLIFSSCYISISSCFWSTLTISIFAFLFLTLSLFPFHLPHLLLFPLLLPHFLTLYPALLLYFVSFLFLAINSFIIIIIIITILIFLIIVFIIIIIYCLLSFLLKWSVGKKYLMCQTSSCLIQYLASSFLHCEFKPHQDSFLLFTLPELMRDLLTCLHE